MELIVSRDIAMALLSKAAGTVSNKDVTPILKNFLIKAKDGKLKVLATDMELGSIAEITLKDGIVKDGTCAAPAGKLLEMMQTAPAGNVCFSLDGQIMEVKTSFVPPKAAGQPATFKNKWVIHTMDPDLYPDFPEFDAAKAVTVDRKNFLDGLDRVSFACASDELKVNMMAVYVTENRMYAADGHRACRWLFKSGLSDIMIPAMAVKMLIGILRASDIKDMDVCKTQHHLLFRVGPDLYHSRLLEAEFPDVEKRVFAPTDGYKYKLQIEREELVAAVRRARVTAEEESRILTLKVTEQAPLDDPEHKVKLAVQSRNNIDDYFLEELEGSWDGEGFERSLNYEYIEDVLKVLTEKSVLIRMGEEKGAVKTRYRLDEVLKDSKGMVISEFTSVILPLRPKKVETAKAEPKAKNGKKADAPEPSAPAAA